MREESCAESMDAKRVELKSGLAEPEGHTNWGFLVPAGILIGLGVGLLFDLMFVGFLVGLGSGLAGSELVPFIWRHHGHSQQAGLNVTTLLIGAFLILLGISFVWAPAAFWPYVFAGLLILAGLWFLAGGFHKISRG